MVYIILYNSLNIILIVYFFKSNETCLTIDNNSAASCSEQAVEKYKSLLYSFKYKTL